ncbi:MAG: CheB methylesterase domain-containing protein, partial [Bdellovibrionota bacterium]
AGLCLLKRVDEKVYAQYLELSSFIVHQDLPLLSSDKVLAIGASFGGTEAITELLLGLPANIPPCVIVQHLPIGMTAAFAEQLDRACPFLVKEAENGERLDSGKVLVAPAGMHCLVKRDDQGAYLSLSEDPKGSLHIPSVDVLFHSIAENLGSAAIGIILTGMGDDGAKGLLAMRKSGARTIAQDKGTSALFGMPAKAIELNAAEVIVPLPEIPALLIYWLRLERHSA